MFCGAGGSTLGAYMAGATPTLGMNHSQVACESYGANHPTAEIDCADIISTDPRRYAPAELLLASPECTHHSYARGRPKDEPDLFNPKGDKVAERSRATMWCVVRFAEHFDYEAVIVENVPAATKWGQRQGQRALKHDEYGVMFSAWLYAMEGLGYEHQVVHLNSMMVGVPQSRDRIYVVFWKKGARRPDLDVRPPAWCPSCTRLVRGRQAWKKAGAVRGNYDQSYLFQCTECGTRVAPIIVPAAAAIDWSLPAVKIGEREQHGKKPLEPATMSRIDRGIRRLPSRTHVVTLAEILGRGPSVDPDGLVVEVGGNTFERSASGYARAWGSDEPMKTIHTSASRALVIPTTHNDSSDRARTALDPLPSQTARQEQALVLSNMNNGVPKLASSEPADTVTTGNKLGLVVANRRNAVAKDAATTPLHALDTKGSAYLVEPTQIDLRGSNAPRLVSNAPLSTVAASGQHHGLAYVVANYNPGWMRPVGEQPIGTTTTTDSHALLTYRNGVDARRLGEPLTTTSTVAGHALMDGIEAEIDINECRFRMLEPHELKVATGFSPDYFLAGSKRDQVKQIGNAVTAPAEAELVRRVMEAIA